MHNYSLVCWRFRNIAKGDVHKPFQPANCSFRRCHAAIETGPQPVEGSTKIASLTTLLDTDCHDFAVHSLRRSVTTEIWITYGTTCQTTPSEDASRCLMQPSVSCVDSLSRSLPVHTVIVLYIDLYIMYLVTASPNLRSGNRMALKSPRDAKASAADSARFCGSAYAKKVSTVATWGVTISIAEMVLIMMSLALMYVSSSERTDRIWSRKEGAHLRGQESRVRSNRYAPNLHFGI